MAGISRRRLADFVARQLAEGAPRQPLIKQVAAYLVAHKRGNEYELLIDDIALALESHAKHGYATVVSARTLSTTSRASVVSLVKQALNVKTVELAERIDERVVGGVRIETADTTYDGTIRRKLQRLGNSTL